MADEPTKDEPTKDEPKKEKEGKPEWAQKLEKSVAELTEQITKMRTTEPKEKAVELPIPPTPKPEEPELLTPDEPEEKTKRRKFLEWLL